MSTCRAIIACVISVVGLAAGCVRTAECDDTVGCTEGRVCYDLQCREPCETADQCTENQACLPCQEDQGAGVIDHCFEQIAMVCVEVQ